MLRGLRSADRPPVCLDGRFGFPCSSLMVQAESSLLSKVTIELKVIEAQEKRHKMSAIVHPYSCVATENSIPLHKTITIQRQMEYWTQTALSERKLSRGPHPPHEQAECCTSRINGAEAWA